VKIINGVMSRGLWFRLPDWRLRPAGPRDREQERTLLKRFDGMRCPLIQREQTPWTEIECASRRIQPDVACQHVDRNSSTPTEELLRAFGFDARLFRPGEQAPTLAADQWRTFKYGDYYTESADELRRGNDLRIVALLSGTRVVGFGVAEIEPDLDGAWEIKIISVDEGARRKQVIETTPTIADQQFTVGVAHVIVNQLLLALSRPVFADATSAGSRYAFKAFGFEPRAGTMNPCLIVQ
jgi:hypothetical protein